VYAHCLGREAGISLEKFHEPLRGEDLAMVKGQSGEQAVLGWFQVDGLPVNRHLLVNEVDVERAVVEGGQRLLGSHSLSLPPWLQG